MSNTYITDLEKYTEAQWLAAVETLLPEIHEVDRNAVRIWFRFYPLELVNYLDRSENPEVAMREIVMDGDFGLVDKIDTSHSFLYGHRFWPQVKDAVTKRAETDSGIRDLGGEIRAVTKAASTAAKTEQLVMAISAVGLMTLNQVGFDDFKKSPGTV